jgi:hypothetical protein
MSSPNTFQGLLQNSNLPVIGKLIEEINELKSEIIVARVTDIVLDSSHSKFYEVGGYNGIGTIFFETVDFTTSTDNKAKPFHSNVTSPPLISELVLLFQLPNVNIGKDSTSKSYYYSNIISLWNSPHCNPYPNTLLSSTDSPSNEKSIDQVIAGSPNKVTTNDQKTRLNTTKNKKFQTFTEKSNIFPLQPYPGDIIYEGRWGNSIRFGSTVNPANKGGILEESQEWSNVGDNGSPITIFRNGQNPLLQRGFHTTVEDINQDQSLIYLTSTQKLPIETINNEFTSYEEKKEPSKPDVYKDPQIILNSNRLVFNAKKDHVLISGEESVFLGGNRSVNINAGTNVVIECGNIKLGSKKATEPLVKGEVLYKNLVDIVDTLRALVNVMEVQQLWPGGVPAPDGVTSTSAKVAGDMLKTVSDDLINIKSKVSKTI